MKNFILGMLFVLVLYPVFESLAQLCVQTFELLKAKQAIQIYKINKEMGELNTDQQPKKTYGFYSLPEPVSLKEQDQEQFDDE